MGAAAVSPPVAAVQVANETAGEGKGIRGDVGCAVELRGRRAGRRVMRARVLLVADVRREVRAQWGNAWSGMDAYSRGWFAAVGESCLRRASRLRVSSSSAEEWAEGLEWERVARLAGVVRHDYRAKCDVSDNCDNHCEWPRACRNREERPPLADLPCAGVGRDGMA